MTRDQVKLFPFVDCGHELNQDAVIRAEYARSEDLAERLLAIVDQESKLAIQTFALGAVLAYLCRRSAADERDTSDRLGYVAACAIAAKTVESCMALQNPKAYALAREDGR